MRLQSFSIALFLMNLICHKSISQETTYSAIWVRYSCDSCAYNYNPLAYNGGNINSATIIDTPDGKCLKLTSSSVIDTNAVPAYFDLYTLSSNSNRCKSLRNEGIVIDNSSTGRAMIRVNPNNSGFRVWLASTSYSSAPQAGESTYQLDPLNANSSYIMQTDPMNGVTTFLFDLYPSPSSPVFNWDFRTKINMYGFTALKPNTDYYIWEFAIGEYLPTKLASYDCSFPGAVMDESLEEKIKIYPNPSTEKLYIEIPDYYQEYNLEIISSSGNKLYKNSFQEKASISMNEFKEGIYLIKVTMGERYYSKKIIKN